MSLPIPKQIRFVPSDGPPAKRRRVSSACNTCRKRKTKCSGEKPQCSTCVKNGHVCLGYTSGEKTTLKEEVSQGSSGEDDDSHRNGNARNIHSKEKKSASPVLNRSHLTPLATQSGRMDPRSDLHVLQSKPTKPKEKDESKSKKTFHKVPYFRYFGPTAIAPGFKQVVVQIHRNSIGSRHPAMQKMTKRLSSVDDGGIKYIDAVAHSFASLHATDLPLYEPNSKEDVPEVLMDLVNIFFEHCGAHFPFLNRKELEGEIKKKRVSTLLVDGMCAIAVRFLDNPNDAEVDHLGPKNEGESDATASIAAKVEHFACRIRAQLPSTFTAPNLSAVQACFMMCWIEFGAGRDSCLWMYLGIAIRMAQDLGLEKGYMGGKAARETFWAIFFLDRVISSGTGRAVSIRDRDITVPFPDEFDEEENDKGADNDGSNMDPGGEKEKDDCPHPYSTLMRVIHLYGRVTDVLNHAKPTVAYATSPQAPSPDASSPNAVSVSALSVSAISQTTTKDPFSKLAALEMEVTNLYQDLSPKLHFNVVNFQKYISRGEASVFIMMHAWFHTLIVLLHRPTLMQGCGGALESEMLSREKEQMTHSKNLNASFTSIFSRVKGDNELAMSSAKTICDILAFAELLDPRALICAPWLSQPIFTAASAFLMERKDAMPNANEPPESAPLSNREHLQGYRQRVQSVTEETRNSPSGQAKLSLLYAAANTNFQHCHGSMKTLLQYWQGIDYILSVMDQKAKGIIDPILYTPEDMNEARKNKEAWGRWKLGRNSVRPDQDESKIPAEAEMQSRPSIIDGIPPEARLSQIKFGSTPKIRGDSLTKGFSSAGASVQLPPNTTSGESYFPFTPGSWEWSPTNDPFAWSMTGTTNSPSSNVTFIFKTPTSEGPNHESVHKRSSPIPEESDEQQQKHVAQVLSVSPTSKPPIGSSMVSITSPPQPQHQQIQQNIITPNNLPPMDSQPNYVTSKFGDMPPPHMPPMGGQDYPPLPVYNLNNGVNSRFDYNTGIMTESENIDVSSLGPEMVGWLDYLPNDVFGYMPTQM